MTPPKDVTQIPSRLGVCPGPSSGQLRQGSADWQVDCAAAHHKPAAWIADCTAAHPNSGRRARRGTVTFRTEVGRDEAVGGDRYFTSSIGGDEQNDCKGPIRPFQQALGIKQLLKGALPSRTVVCPAISRNGKVAERLFIPLKKKTVGPGTNRTAARGPFRLFSCHR